MSPLQSPLLLGTAEELGLVGHHILAPVIREGQGRGKPSGCLCCSCLRISEVPMICGIPVMSQCPGPAQLLSSGEGGTLWGGPGLVQREMVPGEHPCPTATGLLMLGTWSAAGGTAPAAVLEWPSG